MLCRRQQKKTRRGWYRCSMITYHFHIVLHFCTQSWASRLLAASCSRFFFGPCSQHNCAICVKVTNNGPLPKGTRENESKIVKIHQNMLIHFVSFWRIQTIHCIHFQHLPTSTRRFVQTNQTIGDTKGDRKPKPGTVLIADDAAADPPAWPVPSWEIVS